MKRIAIILILIGLTFGGQAQQSDTLPDTCQSRQADVSLTLGISAGASLHFGNRLSPYYSKYGFSLQLPLLVRWDMSPHWQLGTGLRYDFTWNPLYFNVAFSGTWDDGDARGLQFMQTPTTTTQKAFTYISHLGIPLELKWYPMAQNKKALSLSLDLFAGYAVTRYIVIRNNPLPSIHDKNASHDILHSSAIQPWKVEVGFTLSTDLIGLTHGVRLFTNLLPTYKDPTTGEKIYTSGITLFL